MTVAAWSGRHARSILFALVALVCGGLLATAALPVSLFPHINFPRIRVNVDAGDRPAEQMELQVTRPIEFALRSIPGVRTVESTTSRGSAEVSITFDWGQDMTGAYLQAQAHIGQLTPMLPKNATFEVRRMDPTVFPVIAYSLTSTRRDPIQLRTLAQLQLLPALSKIAGVARVGVDGGSVEEIHVTADPARLAAAGLALSDLSATLSAANVIAAVGHIDENARLYLVVSNNTTHSLDAIRELVVRSSPHGITRIGDLASVERSSEPQLTHSTTDGRDCALVNIYQQPGGNTVQIAAAVRDAIDDVQRQLPADVVLTNWYDQSDLIRGSATGVLDAVLIGVGLAAIVLLLFLRDWRMTLVATLSVPLVLTITALLLYSLGQTLNIMTLGGMAAAVGLIIDDAIVIAEHVVRRIEHAPAPEAQSRTVRNQILEAASEFTRPLAGSSLSTIIIHIPPAFLIGVFGAFFGALSLSMASSLIVSFFVAWLVIPLFAAAVLRGRHRPPGTFAQWIDRSYSRMMSVVLGWPHLAVVVVLAAGIGGYWAYHEVPSGVIPAVDEGGFVIDYIGPPGASISEMDQLLGKVEAILHDTPEVQTYSRRTGFSLGGDISESNTGDFFVRLKSLPRRNIEAVMDEVREHVEKTIPGLEIEPAQLMEDLLGDLTGRPQPVVVNLFGQDEAALVRLAPKIVGLLEHIDGLSSIESGVVPAGDAIEITFDPVKASLEGLTIEAATQAVNDLMVGSVATQIQRGSTAVGARIMAPQKVRRTKDDLSQLRLRASDGHLVPLARIATLRVEPGQPQITRLDLQRVVAVTARSSRDLGTTIRDVKTALDRDKVLPAGITYSLGGQYAEQQAVFRGTAGVVAAAATLVFLLLLILYESIRVAVAILLTTGVAIGTVFAGLALTHTELNISSMMGLVMIVGNVTEVAIFYYSELTTLSTERPIQFRLIEAGAFRLRAITMTTLAAILALLPLALNLGHNSGMLQPLAIAIVAGLIVQLPAVLILLPALLQLFGIRQTARSLTVPPV